MLCGMRDELPEAAIGFFPPRLGLIAALGNGRSPKLRREGEDVVAAHYHPTFTARGAVRLVLAHRSSRGRRSIATEAPALYVEASGIVSRSSPLR